MVIVKIEAAPVWITVIKQTSEVVHGSFHSGYILVDKLRERTCCKLELVFQLLGMEYIFVV